MSAHRETLAHKARVVRRDSPVIRECKVRGEPKADKAQPEGRVRREDKARQVDKAQLEGRVRRGDKAAPDQRARRGQRDFRVFPARLALQAVVVRKVQLARVVRRDRKVRRVRRDRRAIRELRGRRVTRAREATKVGWVRKVRREE